MIDENLIRQLSAITEEERRILEGKQGVERELYSEAGEFVVDRKHMLEEGRLIRVRTHTRFVAFPEHTHNYVEMVYMCKGSTSHLVDGSRIDLREGELLLMNQSARQAVEEAGEGDIAVNFIILPAFFDETFRVLGQQESALRSFLISTLRSGEVPVSYMHFQVADVLPVQNLLENLIYSLLSGEDDAHVDEITMGLLFLQLMKCTERMQTDEKSYEKKLVLNALAYIDLHYSSGSLTEYCAQNHLELTSLSKLIKRFTGFTWQELLQQKRMALACELLAASDLSVADVSAAVGYENISFFHRLFKRFYHMSPRQYRVSKIEK